MRGIEDVHSAVEQVMKAKGYAYFTQGSYNLNIVGLRSPAPTANKFDDLLVVTYRVDGKPGAFVAPMTTDPGSYYLKNPMRVAGTAILMPGQYRGAYEIGLHKGKPALRQIKPVRVYRDNTKDEVLDFINPTTADIDSGINIHRSGIHSKNVDKWSAGCQVLARSRDMDALLYLCRQQIARAPSATTFTYTLLDGEDAELVRRALS